MKLETKRRNLNNLIIILTHNCNLRCNYCPIEKKKTAINKEILNKIIDLFLAIPGKNKNIKIFGGEPLLHFNLIALGISYGLQKAKEKNKNLSFEIPTNGTIFNKKILKFFMNHNKNINITISFDLEKKNFYNNKIFLSEETQLYFKKIGFNKLTASLVISPKKINYLFENFIYLLELGFKNFNLLPIFYTIEWQDKDLICLENELRAIIALRQSKNFYLKGFEDNSNESALFNNSLTIDYNGDIFMSDIFLLKKLFKKRVMAKKMKNINMINGFEDLGILENQRDFKYFFPKKIIENTVKIKEVLNKVSSQFIKNNKKPKNFNLYNVNRLAFISKL